MNYNLLKTDELKEYLIQNFVNKEVCSYHSSVIGKIYDFLKDKLGTAKGFDVSRSTYSHNTIELSYEPEYLGPKYNILYIDIKRKKAKNYRHYWESQFDYADFTITTHYEDFNKAVEGFNQDIAQKRAKTASDKQKAKDILKYIMDTYQLDQYDARNLARKVAITYLD